MILLLASLALIAFAIFCFYKDSTTYNDFWLPAFFLSITLGLILFVVVSANLITVNYDYRMAESHQAALSITLQESRENASDYERAMITEKIADFNSYVMKKRARNKFYLLDDFIDDRFDSLKLVK